MFIKAIVNFFLRNQEEGDNLFARHKIKITISTLVIFSFDKKFCKNLQITYFPDRTYICKYKMIIEYIIYILIKLFLLQLMKTNIRGELYNTSN